ncbi:MAG: glycosylase, partial [Planctomycetota bacterium]
MTLPRLETRCLLTPADLPPSRDGFEVVGAFNPAAIRLDDGTVVMLVRVAERPVEQRDGQIASPRYTPDGRIELDWIDADRVNTNDPRMVVFKDTGFKRLTFINHLRVVRLTDDGVTIREVGPILEFHADHAAFGPEDPRLTKIDGTYF